MMRTTSLLSSVTTLRRRLRRIRLLPRLPIRSSPLEEARDNSTRLHRERCERSRVLVRLVRSHPDTSAPSQSRRSLFHPPYLPRLQARLRRDHITGHSLPPPPHLYPAPHQRRPLGVRHSAQAAQCKQRARIVMPAGSCTSMWTLLLCLLLLREHGMDLLPRPRSRRGRRGRLSGDMRSRLCLFHPSAPPPCSFRV